MMIPVIVIASKNVYTPNVYTKNVMVIIVPESKRLINLAQHGFDLADFEAAFSWDRYTVLPAHPSRTGREREMFVGTMNDRLHLHRLASRDGSIGNHQHPRRGREGKGRL